MDSLRGIFDDHGSASRDDWDEREDDVGADPLPPPLGQDERRMQVRAYNMWASLLDNRNLPPISDLDFDAIPDFAPCCVLLDFSKGIENPAITYLGARLAQECGTTRGIRRLSDVPGRSLLSRITDHYMQILANQAPIGFEAEFVNQRDHTILYRGILLPFSNDNANIQHILGVINWKELVDQKTTDALLLEIDQALQAPHPAPRRDAVPQPPVAPVAVPHAARAPGTLPEWADGPTADTTPISDFETVMDLGNFPALNDLDMGWPEPAFGETAAGEGAPAPMELADWLASARDLAQAAIGAEDRTRHSLYAAIGRAYDFAMAAAAAPQDFAEIIADAGLTVQERAPMIPVVKLVFGASYDKTRLTEYATALTHGHRLGLGMGELEARLMATPGGLKGIVAQERQHRRAQAGKTIAPRGAPREALAKKLRQIAPMPLFDINPAGAEFTVLVARRMADGEVVVLGEVDNDTGLLERAAKRLLG